MSKATLVETWALVQRDASRPEPDRLVSFSSISDVAKPLGVNKDHLKRLCELGFLEVACKTRKGKRVIYRLRPNPPPVEQLAEEDRKPKQQNSRAVRV